MKRKHCVWAAALEQGSSHPLHERSDKVGDMQLPQVNGFAHCAGWA